jgi:hypothetical protein
LCVFFRAPLDVPFWSPACPKADAWPTKPSSLNPSGAPDQLARHEAGTFFFMIFPTLRIAAGCGITPAGIGAGACAHAKAAVDLQFACRPTGGQDARYMEHDCPTVNWR